MGKRRNRPSLLRRRALRRQQDGPYYYLDSEGRLCTLEAKTLVRVSELEYLQFEHRDEAQQWITDSGMEGWVR